MQKTIQILAPWLNHYFNFTNKSKRIDMIVFISITSIILYGIYLLDNIQVMNTFLIYSIIPALSVQTRRWNDLNQPKIYTVFSLIPFTAPFAIIYLMIKQSSTDKK